MAFLAAGGIGFIPSESAGELNIIDSVNAKVLKTIQLPAGSRPMRVKLSPDEKRLYVSNGRAGTISVFDSHSYELLDTIKRRHAALGHRHVTRWKISVFSEWPVERCFGGRLEDQQGSVADQGRIEPLGHRRRFPMMKTCWAVMLRVNPSLNARARRTAGPRQLDRLFISLIGCSGHGAVQGVADFRARFAGGQ